MSRWVVTEVSVRVLFFAALCVVAALTLPTQTPALLVYGTGAIGGAAAIYGVSLMHVGAAKKRCPDCAERVLEAARVCRHCGYCFEP